MGVDFLTYSLYIKLLCEAEKVIRLMDCARHSSGLIVRHDIDESLEFAFKLSRLEKKNSLYTTYHILLTSPLYNPFGKKERDMVLTMHNDGFEIGLHFDPSVYGVLDMDILQDKLDEEIILFEKIFGFDVKSYSMHQPTLNGLFVESRDKKLVNAYDRHFFSDSNYISDSAFSFRGKNPKEFVKKSTKEIVQILIHADHLESGGKSSYMIPIQKLLWGFINRVCEVYGENTVFKKEYNEILKNLSELHGKR